MAAVIASIENVDYGLNTVSVFGTLKITVNYLALGDVLSFAGFDQIKATAPPLRVYFVDEPPAGTSASGYQYNWSKGTTLLNGKFQVLQGGGVGAASADIGAGAYPAG